jgi:hypothetical protein
MTSRFVFRDVGRKGRSAKKIALDLKTGGAPGYEDLQANATDQQYQVWIRKPSVDAAAGADNARDLALAATDGWRDAVPDFAAGANLVARIEAAAEIYEEVRRPTIDAAGSPVVRVDSVGRDLGGINVSAAGQAYERVVLPADRQVLLSPDGTTGLVTRMAPFIDPPTPVIRVDAAGRLLDEQTNDTADLIDQAVAAVNDPANWPDEAEDGVSPWQFATALEHLQLEQDDLDHASVRLTNNVRKLLTSADRYRAIEVTGANAIADVSASGKTAWDFVLDPNRTVQIYCGQDGEWGMPSSIAPSVKLLSVAATAERRYFQVRRINPTRFICTAADAVGVVGTPAAAQVVVVHVGQSHPNRDHLGAAFTGIQDELAALGLNVTLYAVNGAFGASPMVQGNGGTRAATVWDDPADIVGGLVANHWVSVAIVGGLPVYSDGPNLKAARAKTLAALAYNPGAIVVWVWGQGDNDAIFLTTALADGNKNSLLTYRGAGDYLFGRLQAAVPGSKIVVDPLGTADAPIGWKAGGTTGIRIWQAGKCDELAVFYGGDMYAFMRRPEDEHLGFGAQLLRGRAKGRGIARAIHQARKDADAGYVVPAIAYPPTLKPGSAQRVTVRKVKAVISFDPAGGIRLPRAGLNGAAIVGPIASPGDIVAAPVTPILKTTYGAPNNVAGEVDVYFDTATDVGDGQLLTHVYGLGETVRQGRIPRSEDRGEPLRITPGLTIA